MAERLHHVLARARAAALAEREYRAALPLLSPAQIAFIGDAAGLLVHWCLDPLRQDIVCACGLTTTPAWGQPADEESAALITKSKRHLYVYDRPDLVTCARCIRSIKQRRPT